jgi:hypothetical protein
MVHVAGGEGGSIRHDDDGRPAPTGRRLVRARAMTIAEVELKFAHLSNRDSPARNANREALREHIEEIQAEPISLQARATPPSGPPFAGRRPVRGRAPTQAMTIDTERLGELAAGSWRHCRLAASPDDLR